MEINYLAGKKNQIFLGLVEQLFRDDKHLLQLFITPLKSVLATTMIITAIEKTGCRSDVNEYYSEQQYLNRTVLERQETR